MANKATEDFVARLSNPEVVKVGDLSLLRTHADMGLDESMQGFDIFTGIWWPLRQKSPRTPRRSVAWLACKLFATVPLPQKDGCLFMELLGDCRRDFIRSEKDNEKAQKGYDARVDKMLTQSLDTIEPHLRWALREIARLDKPLNWAQLIDDLSAWEKPTTRQRWIKQYINR